jgi:hypothetical protein
VEAALRERRRGLPGGSSFVRLLGHGRRWGRGGKAIPDLGG